MHTPQADEAPKGPLPSPRPSGLASIARRLDLAREHGEGSRSFAETLVQGRRGFIDPLDKRGH